MPLMVHMRLANNPPTRASPWAPPFPNRPTCHRPPSLEIKAHSSPQPLLTSSFHSLSTTLSLPQSDLHTLPCAVKESEFYESVLWACDEACQRTRPPLPLLLLVSESPPSYLPNPTLLPCQGRRRLPPLPRPVDVIPEVTMTSASALRPLWRPAATLGEPPRRPCVS
jgi:hypothetical protein